MSSLEIREIEQNKLPLFIKFPFELYRDSMHWIPPMIKSKAAALNSYKNPVFHNVDIRYFLAYSDGRISGRVASIINWEEVNGKKRKKIRFGWLDFINDEAVCKGLLDKVAEIGKEYNLEYMEGPMGISNIDKAGALTEGFDFPGKLTTYYNYPYYSWILKKLGYEVSETWVEYAIDVPDNTDALRATSELILKRNKLKIHKISSKKELFSCVDQMVNVINTSFSDLSTYVPITDIQAKYYRKKYSRFIHPDFVSFIFDKDNKMVAFAITMPDLSAAFKKMNGYMMPFGLFHLFKGFKNAVSADLCLIGVLPKYQRKGVTAILFNHVADSYHKRGITKVEVGPGLETNPEFHALWKKLDAKAIRKRSTFKKNI